VLGDVPYEGRRGREPLQNRTASLGTFITRKKNHRGGKVKSLRVFGGGILCEWVLGQGEPRIFYKGSGESERQDEVSRGVRGVL